MTPEERAKKICQQNLLSDSPYAQSAIAQAIREAVAEEQERCAGVADEYFEEYRYGDMAAQALSARHIAHLIRNTTNE